MWVYLSAAVFAGIVTGTTTNPNWVVKRFFGLLKAIKRFWVEGVELYQEDHEFIVKAPPRRDRGYNSMGFIQKFIEEAQHCFR
jgi:hypothetical protein